MTLGFYYHINVYSMDGKVYLPSYLGLFVDELAKNVDSLYYFAFTSSYQSEDQTYCLEQNNIVLINLGEKPKFPVLLVFGGFLLKRYKHIATNCDKILVRAPSPLASHFYFQFNKQTKIAYLMVNDYINGLKYQTNSWHKQFLIYVFTYINEYAQRRALKNSICLVNSIPLKIKYEEITRNVFEVRTTTLQNTDFFKRTNTCLNSCCINLLFVGRIEKAKGIEELIETFFCLRKNGFPVFLHLVGWNTSEAQHYQKLLIERTVDKSTIIFHGFKTGDELIKIYRNSDIFVLPTHHEGFPRVIWEAMANSLPVISTTVGSIPYYVTSETEAILVPPQDHKELYNGVVRLIEDSNLRQEIIKNAFSLVQDYTMEYQVKRLLQFLT